MKIGIVEDELLVADYLKNLVMKQGHEVIGIAKNINEATDLLKHKPEIILLDIHLENNDSGIDFAFKLNKWNIPFLYITANNDTNTLKNAVQTKPYGYLTKPFNANDIWASLSLLEEKLKGEISFVVVSTKNGKEKIAIKDIFYIEADNVYIHIYLSSRKITQRKTLKDFLTANPSPELVKIHRSYLVNKNHVDIVASSHVVVNDFKVPLSASFKGALE